MYIGLNSAIPVLVCILCTLSALSLIRLKVEYVWTPIVWFFGASALFWGIGPLSYTFGNPDTISYMNRIYEVSPEELLRTNILNVVGMLFVLLGYLITLSIFKIKEVRDRVVVKNNIDYSSKAVFWLLIIGLPIKYLLELPYEFGMLNFIPPRSVTLFAQCTLFAIMLLAFRAGKLKGRSALVKFLLLFIPEITISFLMFNKAAFLMTFIFSGLGFFMANRNLKTLVITMILTSGLYAAIRPIVTYARNEISHLGQGHSDASITQRLDILSKGLNAGDMHSKYKKDDEQAWWTRLSYVNCQAFVMDQYDEGNKGNTLGLIAWVFVPRFIYPEKPVLSVVGQDFTEVVLGHRYGYTGVGMFGEAYWNGGWPMVMLICSFIGGMHYLITCNSLRQITRRQYYYLPCIFLGISTGYRIDAWFVGGFFGVLVVYYFLFLVTRLVVRLRLKSI